MFSTATKALRATAHESYGFFPKAISTVEQIAKLQQALHYFEGKPGFETTARSLQVSLDSLQKAREEGKVQAKTPAPCQ